MQTGITYLAARENMFHNLLLPLFAISLPQLAQEDQDPEEDNLEDPYIRLSVLCQLLGQFRGQLSGPDRAIFVIEFDGPTPVSCRIRTNLLPTDGTDPNGFDQDCHRIWHSYSVGRTIPIMLFRVSPSPFLGLMVMPLPWALVDSFCMQCGSADHATGAHAAE